MSIRKVLTLALAIMMLLTAAGCGNQPSTATSQPQTSGNQQSESSTASDTTTNDSAEKVIITFWFPGEDDVTNNYFKTAAEDYMTQNPNVTVEVTQLPTAAPDVDTKLNAAQLSDTFPDVFSAYLYFIPLRGPKGDFEPLNAYIDTWEGKDDIYQSALNIGKYKDDILGMGFFPAPQMFVYRKDFFEEAGLNPEAPPTTWAEVEEYALKLTKRDSAGNIERAGFDIPHVRAGAFYQPFMWQNGAKIVDVQQQVPMLDDPKVAEAATFLKKLIDLKVNIPFDFDNKQEMPFMNDKAAMGFIAATQYNSLINNDPSYKDKLGIAPVLQNETKAAFSGYRLFTMGSASKNKDAAWDFIAYMMSKEQMQKRAEDVGIPVVRESLTDFFVGLNPDVNTKMLEYVEYGKGAYIVPWNAVNSKHLDAAYEEVVTGTKDAATAYSDAQKALLEEIEKFELS